MAILNEIIEGASGDVPTTTLLRKLRVVSARTGTAILDQWVVRELDGYGAAADLPTYRGPFEAPVLGDFFGAAGSGVRNVGIPPSSFPEDERKTFFTFSIRNPLAEVEEMASHGSLDFAWPPDAVQYYNYGVSRGTIRRIVRSDMALGAASRPIPRHLFLGILEAVRNRILDLALEIEKVAPSAGQDEAPAEVAAETAKVVNNFAFYSSANVAIDSTHVSQTVSLPAAGDESALMRYLGAVGVDPGSLLELRDALAADVGAARDPEGLGPKVRAWVGKVTTTVVSSAASGAILVALKAYLGV